MFSLDGDTSYLLFFVLDMVATKALVSVLTCIFLLVSFLFITLMAVISFFCNNNIPLATYCVDLIVCNFFLFLLLRGSRFFLPLVLTAENALVVSLSIINLLFSFLSLSNNAPTRCSRTAYLIWTRNDWTSLHWTRTIGRVILDIARLDTV